MGEGATGCASTQTVTIPAGNVFYFIASNGAGGSSSAFLFASYTERVQ